MRFLGLFCLLPCLLWSSPAKYDLELSQGYRQERLDFSISGPHKKPDVLSELIFKDIDVYVTRLGAAVSKDHYFLKGTCSYGKVFHGKAVDNDYLFNHRKGLFSHSHHEIPGDYTVDGALRLGRHFELASGFVASPRIGYSAYLQKLRFRHGKAKLLHPVYGKMLSFRVHDLNSTYRSNWYGPELGFDLKKALTNAITLFGGYTVIYPLKYDAKGHWNLREKHLRHFDLNNKSSKSFGNIANAGIQWVLNRSWSLKVEYEFMKFYAKDGHMRKGHLHVPMHKAHLTSNEFRLTLAWQS